MDTQDKDKQNRTQKAKDEQHGPHQKQNEIGQSTMFIYIHILTY